MRTLAMRQASGRRPTASSRAGQILAYLQESGLAIPDLKDVGKVLLLQRAAGRLANAPSNYLRRVPARYRRFRRTMRSEGLWYAKKGGSQSQVHPTEVDLIMLCMLRVTVSFQGDRVVAARLAERTNTMFETVAALQRNQILVDEATDFSPVQLACMAALAGPRTHSLFLSGDFNQRLTLWGSRTTAELEWVAPQLEQHPITVTYRQSRKLADFARRLAASQGTSVAHQAPDYGDNTGYDPVRGLSLNTDEARTAWLIERIKEIQALSEGNLPTTAILLPDQSNMAALTEALNIKLADLSLKAKAFADGEAIGKTNDVRIFPIEHIKGLEFEAVFFLDVDVLAKQQPEMFNRYIYVGATRAATFLGLTCTEAALPDPLSHGDFSYGTAWR
jgi:superfamily I DNA/RNA helicase